jgi:hypothetical protein
MYEMHLALFLKSGCDSCYTRSGAQIDIPPFSFLLFFYNFWFVFPISHSFEFELQMSSDFHAANQMHLINETPACYTHNVYISSINFSCFKYEYYYA